MDSKELSRLTGRRLKEVRERHGLSHVALSDAIQERYGVRIAKDSLINYEVSDEHHTKAYKNNGMRVEYLRYLADFYGVTTDWLLGLSDHPTRKTEELLASDLGISYDAISGILAAKQLIEVEPHCVKMLEGINQMLNNPNFYLLATDIIGFEDGVKKAFSYEKDHCYDGRPIFCEEYPEGTILLGFDSCEYSLQLLKEKFVELVIEISGYNALKDCVKKKRDETVSRWFDCQDEMSDE